MTNLPIPSLPEAVGVPRFRKKLPSKFHLTVKTLAFAIADVYQFYWLDYSLEKAINQFISMNIGTSQFIKKPGSKFCFPVLNII